VAEILSRYANDIEISKRYTFDMKSFNTGMSMKERKSNWDYLKIVFEKNKIPIEDEIIQRVINQAPNSAFDLLLGIYKFLTKKE
jgi:hypothetical protein